MAGRLPDEFELIRRYFTPLAAGAPGAHGLADDVATLEIDPREQLILKTDAIVGGVHFLPDDPPDLVARKLLRVNLSDLAGKGARPLGYLLTCAFPAALDEAWVAGFAVGLAADQHEFGFALLGGDTTATPGPITLSATLFGGAPLGRLARRGDARVGDIVLVSGTLGDAALGLDVQRRPIDGLDEASRAFLVDRYRLPRPRLELGRALSDAGIVRAAMDISDGLIADLGHICRASGMGAVVEWERLPLSSAARAAIALRPDLAEDAAAGGDDYELLFTVAASDAPSAQRLGASCGVPLTPIGRMISGAGVRVQDASGREMRFRKSGYRHFE